MLIKIDSQSLKHMQCKEKNNLQKDYLGTFCSFDYDIWYSIPNSWSSGSISLTNENEQELVRDGITSFTV